MHEVAKFILIKVKLCNVFLHMLLVCFCSCLKQFWDSWFQAFAAV